LSRSRCENRDISLEISHHQSSTELDRKRRSRRARDSQQSKRGVR
jgi:hypothetical protein